MGKTLVFAILCTSLLAACGSGPHRATAPQACAADGPVEPGDRKARLHDFKLALGRCLLMSERPDGPSTMAFALQVDENGSVREADVTEGSTGPVLEACASNAMRALKFEPFCGSDVELRWRVHIQ